MNKKIENYKNRWETPNSLEDEALKFNKWADKYEGHGKEFGYPIKDDIEHRENLQKKKQMKDLKIQEQDTALSIIKNSDDLDFIRRVLKEAMLNNKVMFNQDHQNSL